MIPRLSDGRLLPNETLDPEFKTDEQLRKTASKKVNEQREKELQEQIEIVRRAQERNS